MPRISGLVALAARRTASRATNGRRLQFCIAGVAVAVALVVVVSGIALGLSAGDTVAGDGVDYWLLPESASAGAVVSPSAPRFGDVHDANARIESSDAIEGSTPVLTHVLRVQGPTGDEPVHVIAVGVVPAADANRIAGVSTSVFTPGDPYHSDGDWTGDVVLSAGAAEQLAVDERDQIAVADADRSFTVLAVDDARNLGQFPVAVFRLSELQALTGAADGDRADQFLVRAAGNEAETHLESVYAEAKVVDRGSSLLATPESGDLSVAVGATAFVVAVVVGTLFTAAAMGLEVTADRRRYALLAALGFRARDRALLVLTQTVFVTLTGGVLGVVVGVAGIAMTNVAAEAAGFPTPVATFHPMLAVYALAVSALVGVLAAPYPLAALRRTSIVAALTR